MTDVAQLHFVVNDVPQSTPQASSSDPIRSGSLCPNCGKGKLDYNGLLELECLVCGYALSGGGGCT